MGRARPGAALLTETAARVRRAGYEIGNVSVQVDRQPPAARRRARRGRRRAVRSDRAPVSLAATTTDGLGLTGRGEGVAAIATALVHR